VQNTDNVTPIRPGPPVLERSPFDELQREMMDWLNALSCAAATLSQTYVIDEDERGSMARSTVHACNENLHRLMHELEGWELDTRHGAALAVQS
jgi:hypothetical protein